MNVIVDAFGKRVFMTPYRPDVEARSKLIDTDAEYCSNFETPREKTPRSVIYDFNIERQYEDRHKDEQPDTTDMS